MVMTIPKPGIGVLQGDAPHVALVRRGREADGPGPTRAPEVICNLPALGRSAGASGFFNVAPDVDGTVRRVIGAMNPAGVRIASFKKPTAEELAHDFLWRIDRVMPSAGETVVFNRSQYEDVLVVRVHSLVEESEWRRQEAQKEAKQVDEIAVSRHRAREEETHGP